jgi:hypothetical protein
MSRRARPHYRPGFGWILGVAFGDTLSRPVRLAQRFTCVRCCGAPRASSPHGLAAPGPASHDGITLHAVARLAVATNSPRKGLSPPIQCPCQAHLRRFKEFCDGAASWERVERIIARNEAGPDGVDTRFIATNLDAGSPRTIYEKVHWQRRRAENHIKSFKTRLAADRAA